MLASSGRCSEDMIGPAARRRGAEAASSSGSCSSDDSSVAASTGPLHLRRVRTRRRNSLLLATAAVSAALDPSSRVSAYTSVHSATSTSSRPAASLLASSANSAAPKLSARDLLETALSLRERRRSSATNADSQRGSVETPDLDRLHAQIFGPPSLSAGGGSSTSSSWTEALFDEPESLSTTVDVVGSSARRMESRIREERTDLETLRASVLHEVAVEDDVALRLQEEAAERRRRTTGSMAMADTASTASTASSAEAVNAAGEAKLVQAKPAFVADNKTTEKNASAAAAVNKVKKVTKAKNVASPSNKLSSSSTAITAASKPTNKPSRKKLKQPLSPITERHERITAEEELELARTIQQGSELHNLKSTFEAQHGRDITRQEWTDLAMNQSNLDLPIQNPRDLRRLVSNYRSAKNQLVASNMGLVYAVVRSKHGRRLRMAGVSEDELVQEGSLGLIRAAELFDPERGLRFSTYATVWVKGMLSNCQLDQTIALPAREKAKWNKIRRAAADLALESGDGDYVRQAKPKLGDVATRTGIDATAVEQTTAKMAQVSKVISLDYQYKTARRSDVEEHSGFEHDRAFQVDADLAERLNFKSDVIAALARNLSEEEAQLMRLRYGLDADGNGEGRSLAECAKIMGWSRDKARLLANKCLKKLREADEAEALQEYLLTVA